MASSWVEAEGVFYNLDQLVMVKVYPKEPLMLPGERVAIPGAKGDLVTVWLSGRGDEGVTLRGAPAAAVVAYVKAQRFEAPSAG